MSNQFIAKFLNPARWEKLHTSIAQDRAALGVESGV
jgi:hypothetical protein